MQYNLFYSDSGNGGPFNGLAKASNCAKNWIKGFKNRRVIVEIRPVDSPVVGGFSYRNATSFYIGMSEAQDKLVDLRGECEDIFDRLKAEGWSKDSFNEVMKELFSIKE